jgi:hypothetical protein
VTWLAVTALVAVCVCLSASSGSPTVNWYLRAITDRDTHRGELLSDGTVLAFRPRGAVWLPARRRAGMSGVCQGCRVTGSARWAVSPRDFCVHLLLRRGRPPPRTAQGTLRASAAHSCHQHDQSPPGPACEPCRAIFLADFRLPQ